MDKAVGTSGVDLVDAMLGGYPRALQALLAPPLLYKAMFLGEWFESVTRLETSADVRSRLVAMSRDTLEEALQLIGAVETWSHRLPAPEEGDDLAQRLRRLLLQDLIVMKEGSTEAVLVLAMRAPTLELRERLLALADRDRVHADELRRLIKAERARIPAPPDTAVGVHVGRDGGSLRRAMQAARERLAKLGEAPVRVVVSAEALRHLKDEGAVTDEGTILDLPADVEFGWRGECFAFMTDERVRLAELLTKERTSR